MLPEKHLLFFCLSSAHVSHAGINMMIEKMEIRLDNFHIYVTYRKYISEVYIWFYSWQELRGWLQNGWDMPCTYFTYKIRCPEGITILNCYTCVNSVRAQLFRLALFTKSDLLTNWNQIRRKQQYWLHPDQNRVWDLLSPVHMGVISQMPTMSIC